MESDLPESDSRTSKSAHYGLASRVGAGLGYGVSENVQLALFAGFATHTSSSALTVGGKRSENDSTRSGTVQLIPALRYVTGEGGQRFYVGPAAGFERTSAKNSSDGSNTVSKHGLLGGQLGVYCFIHQHVSLEPGLELYYIRGSTLATNAAQHQAAVRQNDNGLRLMLTLGLSVWSGEDSYDAAPVANTPADEPPPEQEPDLTSNQTQYIEARIDDLSLRILGSPQRVGTEVKLGITTHSVQDPPRCEVALLSDDPPQDLAVAWRLDGADEAGPLQTGSGPVRVKLLVRWLAHNPSLSVCKRLYVVRAELRAELETALARFEVEAVNAGTRQPDPASSAPEHGSSD